MKLYKTFSEINDIYENTAVALGTFDGFHIGHDKLIMTLIEISEINNLKSILYTFSNHPRDLFTGIRKRPKLIISSDQKIDIIQRYNPSYLLYLKFDDYHKNIEAEEFIEEILIGKLKMKYIIVGYDWKFGKKAEGDVNLLKTYESKGFFKVKVIEPIRINGQIVSSTLIRKHLEEGRVEKANEFLGRPYELQGHVVHGKSNGKKIGFPTANLSKETNYCSVKEGVYVTLLTVNNKNYKSVTKVGKNVSFDDDECSVETHILDFDENIYGEKISVKFLARIRDQIKFNSLSHLSDRIRKDVDFSRNYFENIYFKDQLC
ncbi:MAG: bifunctional riboflavin kinase/FAD synthetase [Peptostreptococcaceae bacterium]|nr:bifunctional riboflavin kinase/FAD synthetase [Peptostreptococcaceae bacterium]